ncbi:Uncharacterized protein dnm_096550 [Desulfonema magnum]|uniref:Uncharacterized protein n=1 Tax=Desulfonema magnum TaxID=45655 RepID=A0A975GVM2_9BACT|nr:Uncharacterized protein dnm_096550 [Desulfonema magnum]
MWLYMCPCSSLQLKKLRMALTVIKKAGLFKKARLLIN